MKKAMKLPMSTRMNQPFESSCTGQGCEAARPAWARGNKPYAPERALGPIDLHLDANESGVSAVDLRRLVSALDRDVARRYPSAAGLERLIAEKLGVPAECVLVTAGGDEAIDRACRAFLATGCEIVIPVPTFEMIGRYARGSGATLVTTPWEAGRFPIDRVVDCVTKRTAMIAVVSPNNPTGAVATAADLERLSMAAPLGVLLVDLAYTEFADEDLTRMALSLPNAVVIRTFSKAFGLAGMRVGYVAGPREAIQAMRAAAGPYPVCGLSLAAAESALKDTPEFLAGVVARVKKERRALFGLLRELGASPRDSQGNFVMAEFDDAEWVWRALAGLGIAVRRFAEDPMLDRCLRVTCPGDAISFDRLERGLRAAMRPGGLLLELDAVTPWCGDDFGAARDVGSLMVRLSSRIQIGVMTRRSRREAEEIVERLGIAGVVRVVDCAEDGEVEDRARQVTRLLGHLGVGGAWMLGGTPGDMAAARGGGVVPVAVVPEDEAGGVRVAELQRAGAARVLRGLSEIEGVIS